MPKKKRPPKVIDEPEPLTLRQDQILRWIVKYEKTWAIMPTVREIGEAFDIDSPNGIAGHLKALEAKGWIYCYPNTSRGIVLLQEPE